LINDYFKLSLKGLKSATYQVWFGQYWRTERTDNKVLGFLWKKVNTKYAMT